MISVGFKLLFKKGDWLEQATPEGVKYAKRIQTRIRPLVQAASKEGISLRDLMLLIADVSSSECRLAMMRRGCDLHADMERAVAKKVKQIKKRKG